MSNILQKCIKLFKKLYCLSDIPFHLKPSTRLSPLWTICRRSIYDVATSIMVKLPYTQIKCIACLTIKSPPTFFWFFSLHRIYITLKFVCDIGSRWYKNLHLKLCYVRFLLSDWLFTNFQLTRVLKIIAKLYCNVVYMYVPTLTTIIILKEWRPND